MPKLVFRVFLIIVFALTIVGSTPAAEESLGTKLRKIFAPTPTPTPRKKRHKTSTAKKKSEETATSPSPSASPKPKATETPEPSATPRKKQHATPSPSPETSASATAESSATPRSKKHKKPVFPSPKPIPNPSETPSPTASATASPSPSEQPSPAKKKGAGVATISPNEIEGFESSPPEIRTLVANALDLTARNLGYSYGSADPANGGMDCSGFIYYVLKQSGVPDVPLDASQQYAWLRKAGKFQAVLSHSDDSFELDALKPGDLLFWTGTYNIERDPPVTHTMIYLGREKGTKRRIMVGASDGRTYLGESRYGVSVFDFKIARQVASGEGKLTPSFVGYGSIPGLSR